MISDSAKSVLVVTEKVDVLMPNIIPQNFQCLAFIHVLTSNRKKFILNKNGYVGLPVNIFLQPTNPYISCQRAPVQWLLAI